MSYGEILLYAGAGFIATAVLLLIAGNIVCIVKRMHLKSKLYDKYGF